MTNKQIILGFITSFFLVASPVAAAPHLYLDPTSLTVNKDQEFNISLKIDVESNTVIGADVTLNYASSDQELIGVDAQGYFPEFTWASASSGKIELHAFTSSIHQTKTGSGTIANLKFKSKKDSGSSSLSFGCDESGNQTNLLNQAGANILSCSSLNQSLIVYQSSSTNNPVVSPSPSPSTSTSPANNPPTNTKSPVCTSLTLDPTTADSLPKTINLTCNGYDSDSDITAVEYNFGDGTTQTVSKNIGGSGSITTSHTYTKSGNFKPTCKLKDDKFTSNECSSSLTIQLKSPPPTPKPTSKAVANPSRSPGGAVLSLIAEASPTPSLTPLPQETSSAPENKNGLSSNTLWLVFLFVIIASGGGFAIYKLYRSSTNDIPPQTLGL